MNKPRVSQQQTLVKTLEKFVMDCVTQAAAQSWHPSRDYDDVWVPKVMLFEKINAELEPITASFFQRIISSMCGAGLLCTAEKAKEYVHLSLHKRDALYETLKINPGAQR